MPNPSSVQAYNPYEVRNSAVNRFKGVINAENPFAIATGFVEDQQGLLSFRIGEVSPADIPTYQAEYDERIYSASRSLNWIAICAGNSVFFEDDNPDLEEGEWGVDGGYASEETRVAKNLSAPKMRRVFSGIDRGWIGIDQGKGRFYGGAGVEFALALLFSENSFQPQNVSSLSEIRSERIYSSGRVSGYVTLCEGTSILVDL